MMWLLSGLHNLYALCIQHSPASCGKLCMRLQQSQVGLKWNPFTVELLALAGPGLK